MLHGIIRALKVARLIGYMIISYMSEWVSKRERERERERVRQSQLVVG